MKNVVPSGNGQSRLPGMELIEIKPVILGGDPLDPHNKTWLTRAQHIETVRYWNKVIEKMRRGS